MLNRYTPSRRIEGSNPSVSANSPRKITVQGENPCGLVLARKEPMRPALDAEPAWRPLTRAGRRGWPRNQLLLQVRLDLRENARGLVG